MRQEWESVCGGGQRGAEDELVVFSLWPPRAGGVHRSAESPIHADVLSYLEALARLAGPRIRRSYIGADKI